MYDRYDIPMMVVESGLGAVDKISDDGVDLIGYTIGVVMTQLVPELGKCQSAMVLSMLIETMKEKAL